MPDIMNLNLDAYAEKIREFASSSAERLKRLAEESIEQAKLAMEGAEQLKLLPELLKDAVIAWIAEVDVPQPWSGSVSAPRVDGARLQFFGNGVPPEISFGGNGSGQGAELKPGQRYRFFVVAFPVKFPSEADNG